MIFITILLVSSISSICIFSFLFYNQKAYCFVFEHKDWKLWRYYLKHVSEIKHVESFPGWCYVFSFKDDMYKSEVIMLWENSKACSIHYQNEDCLTDFDPQSKKMYKKLITKIKQ